VRGTYLERAKQGLVHRHHRAGIVKLSTIVRRGEQRDELSFGKELVPIFHDLMSPADQIQVVLLQEARHDVRSKPERDTPVVLRPARDFPVGIRPQQVANKAWSLGMSNDNTRMKQTLLTGVGDVCRPHYPSDLLHRLQVRTQASMHAEYLFIDNGSDRQTIETVRERLPQLYIVPALA
jgi:hypothetical protein